MVAAACSWFSFFTWLPVVCSAVLYVAYMNQNPDVPRRDASWPFTIMLVVINIGGVVYAVASEWLTERSLLFVAAALCAVSLAISSFVHDIVTLVLFLGIVYGLGVASTSIVPTILLLQHFGKYRATALALISGSVDISGMVTPSLVQLLVDRYNFSGCLLIMAGLSLNLFIACIFLRRPSWIEDKNDPHHTTASERLLTSGIDGTDMILKADSHTSTKIPAEDINRERGDDGPPLRTTKAPHKLNEGILRSWFRSTVSLATVHRGSATTSVDGAAKFGSQNMLHRKRDFNSHGSTLELDTGSLIAERSSQLGDAMVVKSKTETRLEAPSQGDVARPDKRTTPDEIEERGFLKDTTGSSLTVSDGGISKTGFLQKLRSVSSVYTWTVCVSKGASNFSSYTFALVAVDYAHDVGVLGQKAALLPALFSSGCLVATLVTGPAVDRSLVSRHSALMVSFVVQAGALISVSTIRSFLVLALGSFLVGLGRGVRCFLFPVLVSDHCRLDDMPAALSIMNAVCSAVLFLRTPLIG
ncbi:unnamed protein product, partial [Ixodes pacificus]